LPLVTLAATPTATVPATFQSLTGGLADTASSIANFLKPDTFATTALAEVGATFHSFAIGRAHTEAQLTIELFTLTDPADAATSVGTTLQAIARRQAVNTGALVAEFARGTTVGPGNRCTAIRFTLAHHLSLAKEGGGFAFPKKAEAGIAVVLLRTKRLDVGIPVCRALGRREGVEAKGLPSIAGKVDALAVDTTLLQVATRCRGFFATVGVAMDR